MFSRWRCQRGKPQRPAARALASRHSTHVALLIPMLSNALFVDLLEGVRRTLRQAGCQTLIGVTHDDPGEVEHRLREQLLQCPAGGVPCVSLMETSQAPDVSAAP